MLMSRAGLGRIGISLYQYLGTIGQQLRQVARAVMREPVARSRLVIILAGFLVCGYAAGVLTYVLTTPEIGIRCAFTTVANHIYHEFLIVDPDRAATSAPHEGDIILEVG